jgi:hypothetical protein
LFYLKKVLGLLVELNALAFSLTVCEQSVALVELNASAFSLTVCERSVAQDGRTMDFYLRMIGFMKNIKRRV